MKITCDDFGLSKGINRAILYALKNNLITHASIMVNQKYTKHAIYLIKKYNLKNIGLHFNISEGQSLYDKNIIFNRDISNLDNNFIFMELLAQIEYLRYNDIEIAYIDVHHNKNFYNNNLENILLLFNKEIRNKESCILDIYNNENISIKDIENKIKDKKYKEIMIHIGLYNDNYLNNISKYNSKKRNKELMFLIKNKKEINKLIKERNN